MTISKSLEAQEDIHSLVSREISIHLTFSKNFSKEVIPLKEDLTMMKTISSEEIFSPQGADLGDFQE
jgi:hypothetical protein